MVGRPYWVYGQAGHKGRSSWKRKLRTQWQRGSKEKMRRVHGPNIPSRPHPNDLISSPRPCLLKGPPPPNSATGWDKVFSTHQPLGDTFPHHSSNNKFKRSTAVYSDHGGQPQAVVSTYPWGMHPKTAKQTGTKERTKS